MQASNVNWFMVEVKQKNLSEAMGFAKTAFNDDAASFFDKFTKSGYRKAFEKNSGRVTLGCSGSELALMIYDQQAAEYRNKYDFFDIVEPKEHWIGHALGYLQGRSQLTFDEIFEKFPLENWYQKYILHEVSDQALWDKTLGQYMNDIQTS